MKFRNLLLLTVLFILPLVLSNKLFAQDEECCDDEEQYKVGYGDDDMWQKMYDDYRLKQLDLQNQLKSLNSDIDALKSNLSSSDDQITNKEKELYSLLGTDRAGMSDFRRKFEETEKRINSRLGTPEDAHKMYFDYVEASRMKCHPEFWERYLEMKIKLMEWEKGKFVDYSGKEVAIGKDGQYTVVKGDCLSGIAGKKAIYGNSSLWPKIYDANKNGVISAPSGVAKLIKNPNLIYPGQVLRIPSLSESEKNKVMNKSVKKIRKKRTVKKDVNPVEKKEEKKK